MRVVFPLGTGAMWFVVSSILSGKRLVRFALEASCVRSYLVFDRPALAIGLIYEGQLIAFPLGNIHMHNAYTYIIIYIYIWRHYDHYI